MNETSTRGSARTRRRIVLTAGGAVGATLLGACGVGTNAAESPGQKADLQGITVEYWALNSPTHPEEKARMQVLENFVAQSGTGIKVSSPANGGGAAADSEKVIAALASGTPPDLVNTHNFYMADYFNKGATADVDEVLKGNADWKKVRASIYPGILKGLTWKGKVYAIPSHNSFFQMYFHTGLLKRAGLSVPPRTWTWDDFMNYAKKAASPPDVTAYDSGWIYPDTMMTTLNNNAPFVSQDGTKFQLTAPEVMATVEWEYNLLKAGLMRPHNGSNNGGYKELIPESKVLFQRAVAARVPRYREQGIEFGTGYYPLGPNNKSKTNYTQGSAYGYTAFKGKDPKKTQAALLASLWASRLDPGLLFAETGGVPTSYKHIIESTEFEAAYKKDSESWPFFGAVSGFVPYPNFPSFWDARSVINDQLLAVWAGKTSIRDGLAEANRQAQLLLDKDLKGA